MSDSFDDFEIPAFERMGPDGSIKNLRFLVSMTEGKIKKLKTLGLRPHPGLLASLEETKREIETRVG